MKLIDEDGKALLTLKLSQWPNNCSALIIESISFSWNFQKVDSNEFIQGFINCIFQAYQICIFTTKDTTVCKGALATSEFANVIHTGHSKYSNESRLRIAMWNPSEGELHDFKIFLSKYDLEKCKLLPTQDEYQMMRGKNLANGLGGSTNNPTENYIEKIEG